jgi:hypothetical protein
LDFGITSGKTYKFKAYILYLLSSSTITSRFGIDASVAVGGAYFHVGQPIASVVTANYQYRSTLGTITNSSGSITSIGMATIEGMIIANNTGTASVRFGRGAGAGASMTIKANSMIEYIEY